MTNEGTPEPSLPTKPSHGGSETLDRLRAQNAELRRLLEKHQWSGLTPFKSYGACPECCGSAASWGGHRPDCAIAAGLAIPDLTQTQPGPHRQLTTPSQAKQ
ncbi:MAG TPA: hypothetical protein VGG41_06850 [Solirubrobacteraceae bacterium]|jgi:hypothetical protein